MKKLVKKSMKQMNGKVMAYASEMNYGCRINYNCKNYNCKNYNC